ncbi:type IV secretory system conjugative DNA transfer family protein [Nocardia arizonensis]|uniref:type IV secretory system conjugative DNA transfer family protein n=1 Tax=Nocardia arizonensis TaxID=1141647 RepID=UPI0006CFF7B6|nr:type IV secretory system conjugative DNA transfer family protein [Nocardia arizonensis]
MAKKKVKDPAAVGPDYSLYAVYAGFAVFGTLYLALHLGNSLTTPAQTIPLNPIDILAKMVTGDLHWPVASTVIVLLVIAAVIGYLVLRKQAKTKASKGRLPVDDRADVMGSGSAIAALTEAGVRDKARQLGINLGSEDTPGVPIGIGVADGQMLYGSYEDLHIDIWGPRQGKSTSRVIPAILTAIGPVLATSNKRDVVDATRDVRAAKGSPTFVFDPQGVAAEEPTWYWDPLKWVDPRRPGYEMRAARLAGHFADSDDGSDAKRDAFFDPEGEDLLAGLFLAAAVKGEPITKVWEWVTHPRDETPIKILRDAGHEFAADGLAGQYQADERTRSGVFGTAKKMVRCLKLTNVHDWVTPGVTTLADGHVVQRGLFDELQFLEANGTLYSLSLEGRGSAAPLVSALTEAVIDVAMRKASNSRGGRLEIPLLAVLDEAANVVRWKDLPKQYSHFGSRGIVVMTVLQSWAQGARCWGEDGMSALWSAANIKVLGSGVDDTNFLRDRSEALGEYDAISQSVSESASGKSYSRSLGSSKTFSVNGLATLPRGRVIVFSSGAPPVLVRTVAWWESEYAADVERSIAKHDPSEKIKIPPIIGLPAAARAGASHPVSLDKGPSIKPMPGQYREPEEAQQQ